MKKVKELLISNRITNSRVCFTGSAVALMSKKLSKSRNKPAETESREPEAVRELGGNVIIQVLAKPGAKTQ